MQLLNFSILAVAAAGLVATQPHGHHHKHVNKRIPTPVADVVIPGPTIVVYELNGHVISKQDVEEGIRNGTLVWANNVLTTEAASPLPTSATTSTAAKPPSTVPAEPTSENHAPAYTHAPQPAPAPVNDGTSGVGTKFPDGQLSCSTFPSEYGALSVDWLGLGGWTGIQIPRSDGGGFSNIETVTSNLCNGDNCCSEGAFCSYACPPGYEKVQWPQTQGSTGQSVGGIQCQGGKLHLTNPAFNTLCQPGTSAVTVNVENRLAQNVPVCRTDYPGTESETIPLDATPGIVNKLTCPDSSNYYTWEGMKTSAQYYVNPSGVAVSEACQWGSASNDVGNFAPLNLGVGYSGGSAWLSIFQNAPTTNAKLDFTVEIVGDNGGYGNLNGLCRYVNGQYCSGEDYTDCNAQGCTVAVNSGSATYVFS